MQTLSSAAKMPWLATAKDHYGSPRWSAEISDCSVPMTFDTYSLCSYGCLYCFSNYQRDVGGAKRAFQDRKLKVVDIHNVERIFEEPESSQFQHYVEARMPFQWGGLSDAFDEFERRYKCTLELLRFFHSIAYPITFSTKGTWWVQEPEYRSLFEGMPWNVKVSIISLDERKVHAIERGVPSTAERLEAMAEMSKFVEGGVTLRLRPFIIGMTDPYHEALIHKAAEAGATAVSTEFFCLETRSPGGRKWRYPAMSEALGYDVQAFYREHSHVPGYLRLDRDTKRPYVNEMERACKEAGIRLHVSDAHFKERSATGSCCGLPAEWGWTRGQWCEALQIARVKGEVRWADIEHDLSTIVGDVPLTGASGYQTNSTEYRAMFDKRSLYDVMRHRWNHPKAGNSPYRMFEGILKPDRLDEDGDVVYVYDASRA